MRAQAHATPAGTASEAQSHNSPAFGMQQVSVQFGRGQHGLQALREVSLSIAPGERVALIGANGCGKSTLLRVLHGLLPPTHGQVQRSASLSQAMVFQRPFLMRMSALGNVALGLWLRGTRWREARLQALHALQHVGLAELAARPARKLSGGQQQRLALARAWVLQPQVLLLDEPTSSLDPHAKREVEALIQQLAQQAHGMTLVFASHNLGQVKRLASRVVYLQQGQVLADLPVQQFFEGDLLERQYPQAHFFVRGETA